MTSSQKAFDNFCKLENLIYTNKLQIERKKLLIAYFAHCKSNAIEPINLSEEDKKVYSSTKMNNLLLIISAIFIMLYGFLILYFSNIFVGVLLFGFSIVMFIAGGIQKTQQIEKYDTLIKQLAQNAFNDEERSHSKASSTDEISKLQKLLIEGAITNEEFALAKAKIISKL